MPVVCLFACLLAVAGPVQRADAALRYATAEAVAADTLRYTARAGQPFIVALPARVGSDEATYRIEEAPALSWLVDRSFFWNIQPGESGTLPVVFERLVGSALPEPFVLLVEITR